jgi:hypothetical protein
MTTEELVINLEYWIQCLSNPTYDPLETGFRHSPLTKDEIINRYKLECSATVLAMERVLEMIRETGIEDKS